MAPLSCVLAITSLLLLASRTAHADYSDVKVWAAFAYINHGEKTPAIGGLQQVLTPAGAQQLYRQGQAFRSRYLTGSGISSSNKSSSSPDDSALIQGISTDAIATTQLYALSTGDEWVASGALAFFQGLYPQNSTEFSAFAGGENIAQNYTNGSNITGYPLQGYQYPFVEALKTSYDQRALGVQGTTGCYARDQSLVKSLQSEQSLINAANNSQSMYQSIFSAAPFKGFLRLSDANFWNAPAIYEFVNYMNQHNETVSKTFGVGMDVMPRLVESATTLKQAENGRAPNTGSSSDLTYMIAGRTLLGSVESVFRQFISSSGNTNKLSVFFGSDDSMIAFFYLAGLVVSNGEDGSPFQKLPEPGAAMVFELVTQNLDASSLNVDDLSVRFYYRASADADAEFGLHSLFGSGMDGNSIPLSGFNNSANKLGMTAEKWCDTCHPELSTAPWCAVIKQGSTAGNVYGPSGISSPVAGVIGGVITLAVTGLAALVVFMVFGVRLRREPATSEKRRSMGGETAGDKDVSITSLGIVQKRVGSWEMQATREGRKGSSARSIHTASEWEADSVMGESQVKAHEGV